MAPIRRYLRITKYSVLEVRIYLDNPAHTTTWLLRASDPALPRVIAAVRPLVLPKLREENERTKSRGKGKRGVKDVVSGDDFEVSVFLTDVSTRHALLTKTKEFKEKPRLKSNSGKLTGWLGKGASRDEPLVLAGAEAPFLREEEDDDDDVVALDDIPDAVVHTTGAERRSRKKQTESAAQDEDTLFVAESTESDGSKETPAASSKRSRKGKADAAQADDAPEDDKKKLGLATQYDGFSIYGRILCLVVKRKSGGAVAGAGTASGAASSQQMLENWVSTQAAKDVDDEDEDG